MKCQRCKSERLLEVSVKCSDMFVRRIKGKSWKGGYQPRNLNLGDNEDFANFTYCLDCGQIQGEFPVKSRLGIKRKVSIGRGGL